MLQHGQVHSSFDNAFAHCCAIIKISGGEFAEDILKLLNKPTEEVEEEKPSESHAESLKVKNSKPEVVEKHKQLSRLLNQKPLIQNIRRNLIPCCNELRTQKHQTK